MAARAEEAERTAAPERRADENAAQTTDGAAPGAAGAKAPAAKAVEPAPARTAPAAKAGASARTQRMHGYERCWDMPFGGDAPGRHFSHVFITIAAILCGFVFKILFRYKVDHREKLGAFKNKSGVMLISNHTSFLDVVFIYLSVWPKMLPRFMARDTLFEGKPYILRWILAHVGTFPVKRDSADRQAVKRASRMLKNHEVVCVLPEGTRRGKGSKKPKIHGGAALIARMGKAPIVPMCVRNAENIKRTGERMRFPRVTMEFGDPILVSDFNFLPKEDRLDGCMWYAMREVFALHQGHPAAEVDMRALFPDEKDFSAVFAEHPIPHHTAAELTASTDA